MDFVIWWWLLEPLLGAGCVTGPGQGSFYSSLPDAGMGSLEETGRPFPASHPADPSLIRLRCSLGWCWRMWPACWRSSSTDMSSLSGLLSELGWAEAGQAQVQSMASGFSGSIWGGGRRSVPRRRCCVATSAVVAGLIRGRGGCVRVVHQGHVTVFEACQVGG